MVNATTVEQLSMQSMRRRETALLNAAFDTWDIKYVLILDPICGTPQLRVHNCYVFFLGENDASRGSGIRSGEGSAAKGISGGSVLHARTGKQ